MPDSRQHHAYKSPRGSVLSTPATLTGIRTFRPLSGQSRLHLPAILTHVIMTTFMISAIIIWQEIILVKRIIIIIIMKHRID